MNPLYAAAARLWRRFADRHEQATHTLLELQGRQAALAMRQKERVHTLADVEFRVFSQWGEDGILDWLIERLAIERKTFVEFGVGTYRESNTRFLLVHRNWRGAALDSDPRNIEIVRNDPIYWRNDLTANAAFVTRDNIDDLIEHTGISGEIGLLSIDIDGNDYWVWERIGVVQPILVACEYNSVFGDTAPITVPYDAAFDRERAHASHLYFGASIAALQHLGKEKGYRFVGTNSAGNNAFFVRNDYAPRLDGRIASTEPAVSRYRESRAATGRLSHARGMQRFALIREMPVVDVTNGRTVTLGEIPGLYSERWERELS